MTPSCSIVLTSYNKAQYVGLAVESALAQTYPGVEIIVVDDGSTDASVEVLRRFGERIRLDAKANGGQASAINRGIELSTGDLVFLLDCDDLLAPDTVERVVAMWTPDLAKVHYRLRRIDTSGADTGRPPMPPYRELPSGDLSGVLRRYGLYPSPPTSGNAFSRAFLQQVMPIPEESFPAWPDTYLVGAAPLFGRVGVLPGFGGSWRESETNYSRGGLDKLVKKLRSDDDYILRLREFAARQGGGRPISANWPQHLKDQLIVAKFTRAGAGPGLGSSVGRYVRTVLGWPEYTSGVRVRMLVWAALMLVVPQAVLRRVPGIVGSAITLA